jgi:transcriptional regulator with XRE-family HTH domain
MSNHDLIKSLGLRIRQARLAAGLSQEELAFKAGVHRTYLGLIERGTTNITLVNYAKIVDALSLPICQLFCVVESERAGSQCQFPCSKS